MRRGNVQIPDVFKFPEMLFSPFSPEEEEEEEEEEDRLSKTVYIPGFDMVVHPLVGLMF
jgi:hypothetical protein